MFSRSHAPSPTSARARALSTEAERRKIKFYGKGKVVISHTRKKEKKNRHQTTTICTEAASGLLRFALLACDLYSFLSGKVKLRGDRQPIGDKTGAASGSTRYGPRATRPALPGKKEWPGRRHNSLIPRFPTSSTGSKASSASSSYAHVDSLVLHSTACTPPRLRTNSMAARPAMVLAPAPIARRPILRHHLLSLSRSVLLLEGTRSCRYRRPTCPRPVCPPHPTFTRTRPPPPSQITTTTIIIATTTSTTTTTTICPRPPRKAGRPPPSSDTMASHRAECLATCLPIVARTHTWTARSSIAGSLTPATRTKAQYLLMSERPQGPTQTKATARLSESAFNRRAKIAASNESRCVDLFGPLRSFSFLSLCVYMRNLALTDSPAVVCIQCDGSRPCSTCVKNNDECTYGQPKKR